MKAVVGELPTGDAWAFEVKWDGMRVLAAAGDPRRPLRLDTTSGADAVQRFPELAGLPARLSPHRVILDGEVVAFDDTGRPNFGRLQHRMHLARPSDVARVAAEIPVCYVVFDLLWLDDQDLTGFTYLGRRRLLGELVEPGEGVLVPDHHVGGGAELLEAARRQLLEGVVAKRVDSRYRPGARSPLWRKVKIRPRQEFVVGGWHPGESGRRGQLGSLLLGYYENGHLRFAGKVGTGFKAAELSRLGRLLRDLATDDCPFTPFPPAFVARTAHWVRPALVAEVAFGQWTTEGILRHPSYIALRDDKDPQDVVRETSTG